MTKDLPDFQSEIVSATLRATSIAGGIDADKSVSPVAEDVYLARDTGILYVCFVSGSWTNIGNLYLLLAGGTMSGAIAMGTNKITGLGTPTATTDASTKAYADTKLANVVEDTTPELGGNLDALTKLINNLGAPVAAADAARKSEVDAVDAKLDDVSWSEPAYALDVVYQNTSGKIKLVAVSVDMTGDAASNVFVYAKTDAAATPTTIVASTKLLNPTAVEIRTEVFFVVQVNHYYWIDSSVGGGGTITLNEWSEWDLL